MFLEDSLSREELEGFKSIYLINFYKLGFFLFSKDSRNFNFITNLIQEKPFHKEFPRKATSLDNEEIYINMNNDFVVKWFPRNIAKIIFPALYFNDKIEQMKRDNMVHYTGGSVPTSNEQELCQEKHGIGHWSRKGVWFCACEEMKGQDSFGPKFFKSYNEWLMWERKISAMIEKAYEEDNYEMVEKIKRSKLYTIK